MTLLSFEESILMVNPVVRDNHGDRAKLDNSLSVIYKSTTTQAQIDSLQQAWQLTVREVLDDSALQIYFLDYNQRTSGELTWHPGTVGVSISPSVIPNTPSTT
jgi:hypothetical protein